MDQAKTSLKHRGDDYISHNTILSVAELSLKTITSEIAPSSSQRLALLISCPVVV
jgi:hypothetical protein